MLNRKKCSKLNNITSPKQRRDSMYFNMIQRGIRKRICLVQDRVKTVVIRLSFSFIAGVLVSGVLFAAVDLVALKPRLRALARMPRLHPPKSRIAFRIARQSSSPKPRPEGCQTLRNVVSKPSTLTFDDPPRAVFGSILKAPSSFAKFGHNSVGEQNHELGLYLPDYLPQLWVGFS